MEMMTLTSDPSASTSWMLGLWVCTTRPGFWGSVHVGQSLFQLDHLTALQSCKLSVYYNYNQCQKHKELLELVNELTWARVHILLPNYPVVFLFLIFFASMPLILLIKPCSINHLPVFPCGVTGTSSCYWDDAEFHPLFLGCFFLPDQGVNVCAICHIRVRPPPPKPQEW